MKNIDFIEKIETQITNGSTDTMDLTRELIHDLYTDKEIYKYQDNGLYGMIILLERNGEIEKQVQIKWETTEINSENTLYFYTIS